MIENKEEKTPMENFGTLVLALILIVVCVIAGGYSTMKYWEWFVTPVFNLHLLTFKQAIGLSFCLTASRRFTKPTKQEERSFDKIVSDSLVYWGIIFLIGLFIHLIIS